MRRLAWETTVLSKVPSRLVVQFGRGREAALFRRSGNFEMHGSDRTAFANAMHQLDAGDGNGCVPKAFEPEHHAYPRFHAAMILLNPVVQVLRRSQRRMRAPA